MRKEELIELVQGLITKCNRCGFCRAVCPSMNELGWECTSPRGRLFLIDQILSGKLPMSQDTVKRIDECLLCRNCAISCPNGTKIDEVIIGFRRLATEQYGTPFVKQVLLGVLGDQRRLFNAISPMANVLEHIPFKESESGGAVFRLYPKARVLPMVANQSLLRQVNFAQAEKPSRKVAYFVGCFTNFMGVNVGRSVINVLNRHGCTVELPGKQVCCGVPYFACGKTEQGVSMVKQNIDALMDCNADAIVYSCGSCGTGLREWSQITEIGPEYIAKAKEIEEKLFEIGEFLVDVLKVKELPRFPQKVKVTYHDSCHLKGAGVKEQPRRLLQLMENVEYVEMPEADTCCGMGGLFSFTHYSLSRKINDRKIKNIKQVSPDVVTSGCPGCNLHIMDGLNKTGSNARVNHYIELISNAYDCAQLQDSK